MNICERRHTDTFDAVDDDGRLEALYRYLEFLSVLGEWVPVGAGIFTATREEVSDLGDGRYLVIATGRRLHAL